MEMTGTFRFLYCQHTVDHGSFPLEDLGKSISWAPGQKPNQTKQKFNTQQFIFHTVTNTKFENSHVESLREVTLQSEVLVLLAMGEQINIDWFYMILRRRKANKHLKAKRIIISTVWREMDCTRVEQWEQDEPKPVPSKQMVQRDEAGTQG